MKKAVQIAMKFGAKGIRVHSGGRLGGAEIARDETYREGRVPLHTLRADIEYGTADARTTVGTIGVKCWIFKGEVLPQRRRGPQSSPSARSSPCFPERTKYRKQQKGNAAASRSAAHVSFGDFGLQAVERGYADRAPDRGRAYGDPAARKRIGKLFIRVFPDKPLTKKPLETRMGTARARSKIGRGGAPGPRALRDRGRAEGARRKGVPAREQQALPSIGASGIVAQDLQMKLHRIGRFAQSYSDSHVALASAALLTRGDVAVAVSHSGTTPEVIAAIAEAKSHRATTVAITNFPLSELGRAADHVLTTAARETALRSGAIASRIAALTVVDCLFEAVAQRDVPATRKALQRTHDAVSRGR